MCLCVEDRVFTGDTLLIGATGRTDLPSGDAGALHESLFHGVLKLDPALNIFPRTNTGAEATPRSHKSSPKIRGCKIASAALSST
jgi:glyoxylase-like metal-dependent hydrolase (beta-lactamase superfamily II)